MGTCFGICHKYVFLLNESLGFVGLVWVWLGFVGLVWVWLGLVGLVWVWLGLVGFGLGIQSKCLTRFIQILMLVWFQK